MLVTGDELTAIIRAEIDRLLPKVRVPAVMQR
jgi:hypothetical protein